jgi:hypothetical protein
VKDVRTNIVKNAAVRVDHLIDVDGKDGTIGLRLFQFLTHSFSLALRDIRSILWRYPLIIILRAVASRRNPRMNEYRLIEKKKRKKGSPCLGGCQTLVSPCTPTRPNPTPPRCRDFGWTKRLIAPDQRDCVEKERKEEEKKEEKEKTPNLIRNPCLCLSLPVYASLLSLSLLVQKKTPITSRTTISSSHHLIMPAPRGQRPALGVELSRCRNLILVLAHVLRPLPLMKPGQSVIWPFFLFLLSFTTFISFSLSTGIQAKAEPVSRQDSRICFSSFAFFSLLTAQPRQEG